MRLNIFKGWRTRIFSGAVFLLGLVETLDPHVLADLMGAESRGAIVMGVGVLTYLLRQITTTPPGRRDRDQ